MLAAPFAAASFDSLKGLGEQLSKAYKAVEERIFFERLVPPVSLETISYARFMELMFNMKVKRIIILAEGTAAIAEVRLAAHATGRAGMHCRSCIACTLLRVAQRSGRAAPRSQVSPSYNFCVGQTAAKWGFEGFFNCMLRYTCIKESETLKRAASNMAAVGAGVANSSVARRIFELYLQ